VVNRAAEHAVFVVHEFVSAATGERKIIRNAADFQRFVRAFPGLEEAETPIGVLIGAVAVPGGLYLLGGIPLLLGKIRTHLTLTSEGS
jgi:hypothetical protein